MGSLAAAAVATILTALLARKASDDATVMRELAGNSEISDEIVGFHAQQAVEKWLKAVVAIRGLPQSRTHDTQRPPRCLMAQT